MTRRLRLFVAFELPPEVQTSIVQHTAPLRSRLPPASWVPADRLHLTLVFLGEVEEARLAALGDALRPVFAAAPRLRLRLSGAGTFPPGRPARVAWIGIEARPAHDVEAGNRSDDRRERGTLAAIERAVRAALAPLIDHPFEERPYHAHVTVARPRQPWKRGAVTELLEACADLTGEWDAERAVLMESRLGAQARYVVRRDFALGREVAA